MSLDIVVVGDRPTTVFLRWHRPRGDSLNIDEFAACSPYVSSNSSMSISIVLMSSLKLGYCLCPVLSFEGMFLDSRVSPLDSAFISKINLSRCLVHHAPFLPEEI